VALRGAGGPPQAPRMVIGPAAATAVAHCGVRGSPARVVLRSGNDHLTHCKVKIEYV